MLRIRYKGRESTFQYTGIRKADVPGVVRHHHANWCRESVDDGAGNLVKRLVPPEELILEWVDGDVWPEGAVPEVLPVPPLPIHPLNPPVS